LAIFFFLRLYHLTIVPVFADEAIYIRWSQVMRAESTLRFLPLSDGKQPLFMWLTIPFLKVFSDPLVAGRMVSVLAGLGTMMGVFLLSFQLFKKSAIALMVAFLYAICPFTVFFDRMALVDSLLVCFGIWTLFFGVLLVEYRRLDLAMLLGMILGGGLLTKSPAIFFAVMLPGTVLLLFPPRRRSASWRSHLRGVFGAISKLLAFWLIAYFLACGFYNILRLGPNFHMIGLRNKDYIFPLSHLIENPWDPFQFHIKEIVQWLKTLLTWPIFLAGIFGSLVGLKKYTKETILILGWLLLPLLVQAEYARVFTPRYILFSAPLLLILASLGIFSFWQKLEKKRLFQALTLGLFFLLCLKSDFQLLKDPHQAPLPRRMRSGYLEEWTSGYGIRQTTDYLKTEAQKGKILVGTEGYFGTLPDGLQIYLEKIPNLTVIGVGYPINAIPESLTNSLIDNRVFLVVNDSRLNLVEPQLQRMKLISIYPKAIKPDGGQEKLLFYEILK